MSKHNLEFFCQLASQDEIDEGLAWYESNRAKLQAIAKENEIPFRRVAAAAAVLSPGVGWEKVIEFLAGYLRGGPMPGWTRNLKKARRILEDGDFDAVRGPKVQAFFDNLVDPDSDRVTVDRWAWRAWVGDPARTVPSGSYIKYRYAAIEADYKAIAEKVGWRPCQLQAVIWLTVRRW